MENDKEIYLVRHASYSRASGDVTKEGPYELLENTKRVLEKLKDKDVKKLSIVTSPQRRAIQSAQAIANIFSEFLGVDIDGKIDERLDVEEYKVSDVINDVEKEKYDLIILVSHKPDIEEYLEKRGEYRSIKTGEIVKVR